MRHIDIIGLTLAELALALLFAFILITPSNGDSPSCDCALLSEQVREFKASNALLRREIAKVQEELRAVRAERDKLKSDILPNCTGGRALFTAVIRGTDEFDVAGSGVLDLRGLRDQFSVELQQAKECRHVVGVRFSPGLTTREYYVATEELRSLGFRISSQGPE